jgi:sRNA-binding regulator protein Hfq
VVRLEETITESRTRVLVEVRYEWEGQERTATGVAQAPPGQVHRLRTVALAAVDALRPLTQHVLGRPSLEGVVVTPLAGMTVVLAAVSVTTEQTSQMRIGSSAVTSSEPEAVVAAVIDAVTKPARPAMGERPRPTDRRTRFEGLRRQHERLAHLDPNAALPTPRRLPVDEPAESGALEDGGADAVEAFETAPPPEGPPPIAGAHDVAAVHAHGGPGEVADTPRDERESDADVIRDLSEIRPEPEGGAASMMRDEARSEVGAPATRPMPRASLEDQFYRRLAVTGIKVHIRCRDGHEIPTAVVKDFGPYSLLVEADGLIQLVFKHAIIAIRPYGPLPPEHTVPS